MSVTTRDLRETYERDFGRVLDRVNASIEDAHDLAAAKRHLHRALGRRDRRSEDAAYLTTALESIEEVRK